MNRARTASTLAQALLLVVLTCPSLAYAETSGPGAANPSEPSWDYVLHVPGERGLVSVTWTLHGLAGRTHLCTFAAEGGVYFSGLRSAEGVAAQPDKDDSDCWWIEAPPDRPVVMTYQVDLPKMAEQEDFVDWAVHSGGGFLFTDRSVLLAPDPFSYDVPLHVTFDLPDGWTASTPWDRLPGKARFTTNSGQFDGHSYLAAGPLMSLGELPVRGGVLDLVLLGSLGHAAPEKVREWVRRAAAAAADLYEGLPAPRVEVILVAIEGTDQAGIFGSVFRPEHPSVVFLFCPDGPDQSFAEDWIPSHELVHLGNPELEHRVPWFTEGVATYYQDVLRGRTHTRDPLLMWGDLYDGFRGACDPSSRVSLSTESAELRSRGHYSRVYWGGACLLFRADVAIRQHSQGKRSLDDVVREALRRSREEPLTADQLVELIDQAAGRPIATEHLATKKALPMKELYRQLGIEPTGPDTVRLHDEAPLAWIRKGIFQ